MDVIENHIVRVSVVVTGCVTAQSRGIHFCGHKLLSGNNCNLWFPVANEESWFEGIERVLIINGLAENMVRLEGLSE